MFGVTASIFIFFVSLLVLVWSGSWVVGSLSRVARYLGWREFVVAFFLISIAGALPNFAVGISSVLQGIPELSLGDIMGGNLVHFTLTVALVVLLSGAIISVDSITVQASIIWALVVALLPLLLISDGILSRSDGLVLLLAFGAYMAWLFSKDERFKRVFNGKDEAEEPAVKEFRGFIADLIRVGVGLTFLVAGSYGIVESASSVAHSFNLPVFMVGLLIVGLGNTLPETYFAIAAAKKGRAEMIMGDIMGSVMAQASLVLGMVAILRPIHFPDLEPLAVTRIFLVISVIFFFVLARTGRKITRIEALILLGLYVAFLIVELLIK